MKKKMLLLTFDILLNSDNVYIAHELYFRDDFFPDSKNIYLVVGPSIHFKRINVFKKYVEIDCDSHVSPFHQIRDYARTLFVGDPKEDKERGGNLISRNDVYDIGEKIKTNLVGEIMSTKDLIGSKDKQISDLKLILATKETEIYRLTKSLRQANKKKGPWDK